MSAVIEAQLAQWRDAIGREEVEEQVLSAQALERFARAIGHSGEGPVPLGHWAFFTPSPDDNAIGSDGHPRRGAFLPDVTLERRMFAASEMRFHQPLVTGTSATITSRVADIAHKRGASGDLVFAKVDKRIEQGGAICVRETQTFVYRNPGASVLLPTCQDERAQEGDWTPNEVNLFRFSAATGNAHRIHYDLAYARDVENYPALIVHGPFTAAKLASLAMQQGSLAGFAFKAKAPLFCGQPIRLRSSDDGQFEAVRCDGVTAMSAWATYAT